MKKLLSVFTAAAITLTSFAAYSADNITVTLDGQQITFDVPPQIINDRTMVPMRAIFEALGADVLWDDSTKTVTAEKDGTDIIMNIGYNMIFVNYIPITLDAPPQIIEGRTLVPVRAIAESLDCTVDWEEETRTVTITTASLSPSASPEVTQTPEAEDAHDTESSIKEPVSPSATKEPKTNIADPSPSPSPVPETGSETESTAAASSPENVETAEPSPSPQAESVVTSADTEEGESEEARPQRYSGGYNIVYDDENEKQSHYCSDFTITDVQLNEDGNYEITYTLKTYRDDSGNVILSFACYDEDGGRVDGFSELFHTWAYSWTEQEAVAVISGKTTRIKLLLNE